MVTNLFEGGNPKCDDYTGNLVKLQEDNTPISTVEYKILPDKLEMVKKHIEEINNLGEFNRETTVVAADVEERHGTVPKDLRDAWNHKLSQRFPVYAH